jgi:predicted ribosomally synthesized peptide with SipW-like signal peptide
VSTPTRSLLAVVAIALVAALAGVGTWAAYSADTTSTGNSFASGTVALIDNDAGVSKLSLTAAKPGDSDRACIVVTYTGTLASAVRLYGTTTGSGLDAYLDLTVTRGSFSGSPPAFDSCTNFVADGTGAGNDGVIYNGTLQGFPDDYAAGLVDPLAAGPETWTNNESHVYQIEVTLQDNLAARSLNAVQTFTWEARNT